MRVLTKASQRFWDDLTCQNRDDKRVLLSSVIFMGLMAFEGLYSMIMAASLVFKHPYPLSFRIFYVTLAIFDIYLLGAFIELIKRYIKIKKRRDKK